MPKTTQPRIKQAVALEPFKLRVTWTSGKETVVDLGRHLRKFRLFRPLLQDKDLWSAVRIDPEFAYHVFWEAPETDLPLEIPAPVLWRLHLEQVGEAMSPASFNTWMESHGLSLSGAAGVLGISRRMAAYYKSGERIIPKYIRLACLGAEREMQT